MKFSIKDYTLHFKHTFRVAGAKDRDSVDTGILQLEWGDITGFGEAQPSRFWGENLQMVHEAAAKIDLDRYSSPFVYEIILKEIEKKYQPPQALKAALDMALFDCIGKKMKIPVRKFFGFLPGKSVITSFTIGFAELDIIEQKIKEAEIYPILKVKLGTSYDIEIIEKIRSITKKPLRVDANGGWLKEEAVEKINWLETQNVEFIEQPLPAGQIEETMWLKERVNLPLIADESVKNSKDINKVADAFDGINIKLMKCGGILEAIKMIRLARQQKLTVMLGCMTESSLGISAAANLLPLADYADLDSHLLITNDPFEGLGFENGIVKVPEVPGLGIAPIERKKI